MLLSKCAILPVTGLLILLGVTSPQAAELEHDEEILRINLIAEKLNAIGDELCPECGYFIFSEDQKSLRIQVKGGVTQLTGQARDIYLANRDVVDIEETSASLREMREAMERVYQHYSSVEGFREVFIGNQGTSIDVVIAGEEDKKSLDSPRMLGFENDILEDLHPNEVLAKERIPLHIHREENAEYVLTGGRYSDYSRFYMGGLAHKKGSYGSEKVNCSLGVPVMYNGRSGVLTAAHCGKGSYDTSDRKTYIGSTVASSYEYGRHDGDWQILAGSTYANRVFTGPADTDSTESLPISGVNLGRLELGRQLCASGQTTGQTCRYYVTAQDGAGKFVGYELSHLIQMEHRSNHKNADCNGFKRGDSGGPMYYADGRGGVIVNGLVTGYLPRWNCTYYATSLSSVSNALPGIRFLSTDR